MLQKTSNYSGIPFHSKNKLGIILGSTQKKMGIISGTVSFRRRFGNHLGVGDHFWVGIISGAVQSVCALSSVFEFAYE